MTILTKTESPLRGQVISIPDFGHIILVCSATTELIFLENKIAIGSVTYALKGRDVLRKNGYRVGIERKPSKNSGGCGYSLKFTGDLQRAKDILDRHGIKYKYGE